MMCLNLDREVDRGVRLPENDALTAMTNCLRQRLREGNRADVGAAGRMMCDPQ